MLMQIEHSMFLASSKITPNRCLKLVTENILNESYDLRFNIAMTR